MKHFIVIASFLLSLTASGQNWDEWMRQKRTQIRYLVNQVAALQVYIDLGKEGYAIYKDGLELIGEIKDGEFNLHKDHFASLSDVNSHIAGSPKVNEVLQWNQQVQHFDQLIKGLQLGQEQASIQRLFAVLVQKSAGCTDQMKLLITDGHYQLKDKERIEQIDKTHLEMTEIYGFARSVYNETVGLRTQKTGELIDVKVLRSLNGLQ